MPKKKIESKKIVNLPSVKLPTQPMTAKEIERDMTRRISNIQSEFTKGFNFIKKHPKSVTFFGSARLAKSHPYYKKAARIGSRLAAEGYSVLTGGGPGIMEAANKGAKEAKGQSLGLTIKLPDEQNKNPFVTDFMDFYYFFTRKVCLTFSAEAYLYFPGGFGTLDEFFEIVTLVQTNKISKVPIILVGSEFWKPLEEFMESVLYQAYKTINKSDLDLYTITDDEDEIVKIVKSAPIYYGDGMPGGHN